MTPKQNQAFAAQELFKITDYPKAKDIILKYGGLNSDNKTPEQEAYLIFVRDFDAKMLELFPMEQRQDFLLLPSHIQQQISSNFMEMQKKIFFEAHVAYQKHIKEAEKEQSTFFQQISHLAMGSYRGAFDLNEWIETKSAANSHSSIPLSIKNFQSSVKSPFLKAQTPLGEPEGLQYSLIGFKKKLLVINNILSDKEDFFSDDIVDEWDIEKSYLNNRNSISDDEEWDIDTIRVNDDIKCYKKDLISIDFETSGKEVSQNDYDYEKVQIAIKNLENYWAQAFNIGYLLDTGIITISTPAGRISQIGSFLQQVESLASLYDTMKNEKDPKNMQESMSKFLKKSDDAQNFFKGSDIEKYFYSVSTIAEIDRDFCSIGKRLQSLSVLAPKDMTKNYQEMNISYFNAYNISRQSIIQSLNNDDIDSLNNQKEPTSLMQIQSHLKNMIKNLDDLEKSTQRSPALLLIFLKTFNQLIVHLTESFKRKFSNKQSAETELSVPSSMRYSNKSIHRNLYSIICREKVSKDPGNH